VAELKAKVELTFGELKQKQKLTREEYAKAANNFRELGTLLASLKAHSPDVFKGRFLAPNAEKFDFPFTYEKARAIMNFAAKNSSPVTARKLESRPGLVSEIIRVLEMT
jgi:hypothetical protein